MKKTLNFLKILPKSVKTIILINLIINLIFICYYNIFGFNLNLTFGAYPICSENFELYRILTFMFSHSLNIGHIISNIVIFIIFASSVSNKIGNYKTYLLYIFSGVISFIIFNNQKNYENKMIKKDMISLGIDVKKINQLENGVVEFSNFKNMNEDQKKYLNNYPYTNSYLSGSSGSVFSFVLLFLFFNIKEKKMWILNIFVMLLLFNTFLSYIFRDITTSGSTFGHLGGILGGLIFFIYIKILELKKGAH